MFGRNNTRINGYVSICDGCLGACCIVMEVPELNKKYGERCKHLGTKGECTNYDSRPESCRKFDCIGAPSRVREALTNQSLIEMRSIRIQ